MEEYVFFIGELSRQTGTSPKTIRYYEDIDILPSPKRGANNYRLYSRDAVKRIEFIKKAQSLGFTLKEIGQILEISDRGLDPCGHIEGLLKHKIVDLENQLEELKSIQAKLKKLEREWMSTKTEECLTCSLICPKIEKFF